MTGVYILQCSNERYYVGSTKNLDRRLREHHAGLVRSTARFLPVKLVLFQPCPDAFIARKLEYRIKRLKSKALVERMIQEGKIQILDDILGR